MNFNSEVWSPTEFSLSDETKVTNHFTILLKLFRGGRRKFNERNRFSTLRTLFLKKFDERNLFESFKMENFCDKNSIQLKVFCRMF